jgi:hypothetical protein
VDRVPGLDIASGMAEKSIGLHIDQRTLDIPKSVFAAVTAAFDSARMQVLAGSSRWQGHGNLVSGGAQRTREKQGLK